MSRDILIVDDEADIRELISGILSDEGYETRVASDSDQTLAEVKARRPSLIVLDIWLHGSRLDGLELLDVIKTDFPDLPIVIISGHGNIETAVSAIQRGAYDFVEKPFKADRLILAVERALEADKLREENRELRLLVGENTLVGSSQAMNQLRQTINKVAPTGSRILVCGHPGSGKEVVARTIHAQSKRGANPFVAINAATMSPERVEEELFGVEESNGNPRRIGVFERAHNGTLFLDEIAEMPLESQSKILRVLVEQTFQRIGGGPMVKVDVRIVSSTSRNLRSEIEAGRFREDLYHRLNVVPVDVPSLSERREDIPELINYFIQHFSRSSGLPTLEVGDDAMAALQTHDWPGNVRQLRNNVERLLILATGQDSQILTAELLPDEIGSSSPKLPSSKGAENVISLPLREAREMFEREYLMAQINRFGGNISRTASFIGMERSALHRKLKSLGLNPSNRQSELNTTG